MSKTAVGEKKRPLHEGELLSDLISYLGIGRENFCLKIGISSVWLRSIIKRKVIPQKNKVLIYREFDIPKEYWTGNYSLPSRKKAEHEKSDTEMLKKIDNTKLEECIALIREKDKIILDLQKRVMDLMVMANK